MSKRRYKFNVTDINELAKAFPTAVTETHIPALTEFKPNYAIIAKLLDCEVIVPGIELADFTVEVAEQNKIASIAELGERELPPVIQNNAA